MSPTISSLPDITKLLSEQWKNLSVDLKRPYEERAAEAMAAYKRAKHDPI
jgi:hypothetical protein